MGMMNIHQVAKRIELAAGENQLDSVSADVETLNGLFEEIAQFVLTAMVTVRRGFLDGFAVFNLTTSGFNFVLNLLDMIEIGDDDED